MPALLAAPGLSARPTGSAVREYARAPPPAVAARWIRVAAASAAVAAAGASRTAVASASLTAAAADDHPEGSLAVFQLVGGKWEPVW